MKRSWFSIRLVIYLPKTIRVIKVTYNLHIMLEPYAWRRARTDLRGGPQSNLGALPGIRVLGVHNVYELVQRMF
jgi:hypothetical protein